MDMENSVMIAVGGMGGDGEGYKRDKWWWEDTWFEVMNMQYSVKMMYFGIEHLKLVQFC